jgi:hypothetical protein
VDENPHNRHILSVRLEYTTTQFSPEAMRNLESSEKARAITLPAKPCS